MNYRRNEDRRSCYSGPNYNIAYDPEDITDESGGIEEPVTLEEVKNAMRLEGWDESGELDFDDALILEMITSARQWVEVRTDQSLIPKTLRAVITNGVGRVNLRGGPVTGTVTIVDSEETAIVSDDIKLIGIKFPELKEPIGEDMVATYDAGYTADNIPKGLKMAIIVHVIENYENRGDEMTTIPTFKRAASLCSSFIKGSAFA